MHCVYGHPVNRHCVTTRGISSMAPTTPNGVSTRRGVTTHADWAGTGTFVVHTVPEVPAPDVAGTLHAFTGV
jgi:hypothetical protein